MYLRSYALDQMVQAASSSAGLRTIKRVEQLMQDLGVCLPPFKQFFFLLFSSHKPCASPSVGLLVFQAFYEKTFTP